MTAGKAGLPAVIFLYGIHTIPNPSIPGIGLRQPDPAGAAERASRITAADCQHRRCAGTANRSRKFHNYCPAAAGRDSTEVMRQRRTGGGTNFRHVQKDSGCLRTATVGYRESCYDLRRGSRDPARCLPSNRMCCYEGDETRVPDAEHLDVDRVEEGLPVRMEVKILIADGPANGLRPYSPHQKLIISEDGNATRAQLEKGMPLNRDLVIRWAAGCQQTGVRAIEGHGLPCDNGRYILITLTPPKAVQKAIARDLTLLIDASGSMQGKPMEQAKTVAAEMLHSLDSDDRFEILAFSDNIRRLTSGPMHASEKNIEAALNELRKLRASGSTEMTKALTEALKPLRPDSQRQIVLLSDGYIGFENEVIGKIRRKLVSGARVHVVGVGSAPNRTLTKGAARAGRGVELIIGLEEDPRKAVQ